MFSIIQIRVIKASLGYCLTKWYGPIRVKLNNCQNINYECISLGPRYTKMSEPDMILTYYIFLKKKCEGRPTFDFNGF